jgi:cell division protein FtsN
MSAFKGIQKYLIYICIAGWMFFLGIVVGRGTSPVNFDTREFSKKLEKMANIPEPKNGAGKKIDLKFYEDLDHPTTQESLMPKNQISADIPVPKPETDSPKEPVKEPVKEAKKEPAKETPKESVEEPPKDAKKDSVKEPVKVIKKILVKDPARIAKKEPVKEITRESTKSPEKPPIKEPEKVTGGDKDVYETEKPVEPVAETITPSKGVYTIQIAAYKSFQEAVSKMAALEEKGFSTYRVKGENEGTTWYRVRMGPFETYDGAKEFKARLDKAGIDAMIMKRETDEDIKE